MHSQTLKFARNGAFGAIGLYLLVALPLLATSMAPPTANAAPPVATDASR